MQKTIIVAILSIVGLFMFSCKKDTCPLGQKNVSGKCMCKTDSNCPKGEICRDGQCIKEVKSACPAVPCKDGKVCDNGLCRDCTENAECGTGKHCWQGSCRSDGNQCDPDRDCPLGQKCDHGYCVADASPGTCVGDECKITPPCELEDLYFEYKSANLSKVGRDALKKSVECMKKGSEAGLSRVHLIGMADPRGPETYNDDLSSQRLKSVQDEIALLAPGLVGKYRFTTEPLGESCATGKDEGTWAKDRRVHFMFYKKVGQVCPE